MAICLPGMASRVKRAETSATRSEPLVMTKNCTNTMMRKITRPTTTSPWMTNSPKVFTTSPAYPWFFRMLRVEEMFSERRNRVVISSREG